MKLIIGKVIPVILLLTIGCWPVTSSQSIEFSDSPTPPTTLIENLQELLRISKTNLDAEIEAHEASIARLKEMKKVLVKEEEQIREMASSIFMVMVDLPHVFEDLKTSSFQFAEHVKKLHTLQTEVSAKRNATFNSAGDILKIYREMMELMNGRDEELPPLLSEILGDSVNIEKDLFDTAYLFYMDENWEKAYDLFAKTWYAFNVTESRGLAHFLGEVYILDHFQYSAYKLGRLAEAVTICNRALKELPSLTEEEQNHFKSLSHFYQQELIRKQADTMPLNEQIYMAKNLTNTRQYSYCLDEYAVEAGRKLSANPNLICRYDNRNRNPILILAPVKEEFLSLDPLLVIMYDIVDDSEIIEVKTAAESTFQTTRIIAETDVDTQRARVAWLETLEMPKLNKRLEAYTGLNPFDDGSEVFQVAQYRIAGHYVPHYNILFGAANETGLGDRIATLLIYLSDVEEGGGTVFNELRLRVTPSTRAGLFWYNFHKNETADLRTLHCSCPVIRGEKFVVNKWFRFRGQLLHKPCGQNETQPFSSEDYNLPQHIREIRRRERAQKLTISAENTKQ